MKEKLLTFSYHEVEKMLEGLVSSYYRKYGQLGLVTYDELKGEAQLAFILACKTYDINLGQFTTHLHHKAYGQLQSFIRKRLTDRRNTYTNLDNDIPAEPDPMKELLESLSPRAEMVVKLSLNPPQRLRTALIVHGSGREARSAIRSYLRKQYGWKQSDITETFNEIKEAL